jgi:2-alkenal reductase
MNFSRITIAVSALTLFALACQATAPITDAINLFTEPTTESQSPNGVPTLPAVAPNISVSSDLISQQDALISLYEAVSPGVVSIYVETEQGAGQGSGFVIDSDGHIVTNFHVVQGATYLEVSFSSGLKAVAEIVGVDADSDLAVIQADVGVENLRPLALGDSEALRVGEIVVAIGNPFGLSGSMSTGIVSSLGRTLDSLNASPGGQLFSAGDLIQTDAAINPGNSGGPLLNLRGEVIGVNRAISTFNFNDEGDTLNSGIGFAVSVNIVKRVAPSLISTGSYDYPYLGLSSISSITLADAETFGYDRTNGVFITEVAPDGPSDQAGLEIGDAIIAVDGRDVRGFDEMISYLFNHTSPGDTVQFIVLRAGEEFTIDLILGARP